VAALLKAHAREACEGAFASVEDEAGAPLGGRDPLCEGPPLLVCPLRGLVECGGEGIGGEAQRPETQFPVRLGLIGTDATDLHGTSLLSGRMTLDTEIVLAEERAGEGA